MSKNRDETSSGRYAAACPCYAVRPWCGLPVSAGINPQISDRQPVQKNGQFEGQVEWIRKTLREGDAQRVYQGRDVIKRQFPLAGMGTGIVYFNGNLVPYAWDVGQLESGEPDVGE